MSLFKIGEIALLVPHQEAEEEVKKYQGSEVKIVGAERSLILFSGFYYEVEASDGFRFFAKERVLMKKKPPKEDSPAREWFDKNIDTSPPIVSPEQVKEIVKAAFMVEI